MTNGENKNTTEAQPADTKAKQEPDIIDVEVIKEDAAPKASPEKPALNNTSKSSSKLAWFSVALLASFIGGIYAAPYFKDGMVTLGLLPPPPPAAAGTSVNLEPIENSLADLKAQLLRHREILAQHEGQIASSTENTNTLSARLNDLTLTRPVTSSGPSDIASNELSTLKAATERLSSDVARLASLNTADNPEVTQLSGSLALLQAETRQINARFAALEAALADIQAGALDASPRGRLLLTLSRMKERAMKGFSFNSELEALRPDISALSTVDQQLIGAELAVLQQTSPGIDTYEALTRSFDTVAATALQSAQKEEGNFLSSLFTVRRTDEGASGNDAIFLAAERKLSRHDLAGTITELEKLEGAALASTKIWRDKAQKNVDTARAFERIISTITNAPQTAGGQQ